MVFLFHTLQGRLPFPGDYVWYDSGEAGEFSVPIGAKVKTVTEEWLAFLTEDHEVNHIHVQRVCEKIILCLNDREQEVII